MKNTMTNSIMKTTDDLFELHAIAVKDFLQYCKNSMKAKFFNYVPVYGNMRKNYPSVDIISTGKLIGRKFYTKIVVKHRWFNNYSVNAKVLMGRQNDNYVFIDQNVAYVVTSDMLIASIKQSKENTFRNGVSYYLVPISFIQKHGRKLIM